MNLITVKVDSILIGQPLSFALRDESGVLLLNKGHVLKTRGELDLLIARGANLYIDIAESEAHQRAYVGQLHTLLREETTLGQIAESQFSTSEPANARDTAEAGEPDWLDLQAQTHVMLRDNNPATFLPRLDKLQAQLNRHARLNPDGTLFALIHLSSSEMHLYSATHAMLVSVMCSLAAREVLKWPAALEDALCRAALTMNIGMSELQDKLALQKLPPTAAQVLQIQQHSARSASMLRTMGVTDIHTLEAVLDHHNKTPGPLAPRTPGQRMARLIQRADIFAARLAPRAARLPDSPARAMQASYFDENRQIDEAGAALVKAVGIYSPGSFVRLATNEVAVVIKRGANTTTPRVAILINRAGMPTGELIVRDTSQRDFRILASLQHHDVKVKIHLERLLALTKAPVSDRLW